MKIILNKTYDGLGNEGDIVNVKNGYARNYLIPLGIAKNATENNIAAIKKEIERFFSQFSFQINVTRIWGVVERYPFNSVPV